MAQKVEPRGQEEAARQGVAARSIDWGKFLRVAGSYLECEAIRMTLLRWYPFAACVPNPDGKTWLVVIAPW